MRVIRCSSSDARNKVCSFDARNKVCVPAPARRWDTTSSRRLLVVCPATFNAPPVGTCSFCHRSAQARELEAENKQLRRTISSLTKATAAERDTYLALQSELEGYQHIVGALAQEYDLNRSPLCARARCSHAATHNLSSSRARNRGKLLQRPAEKRAKIPPFLRRSGSAEDLTAATGQAATRPKSGGSGDAGGAVELGGGKQGSREGSLAELVQRLRS